MSALTLPAFAKINLDLRVLGVRPDGYHDLRTIFQSLALHDVLTFERRPGPFAIESNDPKLPLDRKNVVWTAASLLWKTVGRGRSEEPRDVLVQIRKRIPQQAGLGGGSSDAATALLGLLQVWRLKVDLPTLSRISAAVGADVPFFLVGGTALGLGRGDDIYPLSDLPRSAVVIVRPQFGVSTAEAFEWFDTEPRRPPRDAPRRRWPDGWPDWALNIRNDLEPIVAAHHPTITRIKHALIDAGAVFAAMSGSGSAVFGLFDRPDAAARTARDLARPGWMVVATRTLSHAQHTRRLGPALAASRNRRIS